jgi:hypothetical protein
MSAPAMAPTIATMDWSVLSAIRVQTVTQILALEASRPTFLLEDIVHSSATLLYGPAKAGKSHLVVELVTAISRGTDWHGRAVNGGRRPVLVLSSDPGSRTEYSRRFGDAVDGTVGLATPPRVGDFSSWRRMASEAADAGVGLVVLDNLYSWARQADINANAEVGAALECLDQITDAGMALLVVHHTTKGGSAPAGTHAIEASFRHLVGLKGSGELVVRGNDVPETRHQLRRDAGVTREVATAGRFGYALSGDSASSTPVAAARRNAREERVELAQALLAAAPAGLSDRALARYLVENVDGIRTESQGRSLLAKVKRLGLATAQVSSTSG